MKEGKVRQKPPRAVFVFAFVLLAFLVAVGPRFDYPYPIHVDEWTHLAYADALIQNENLPHADPLYGMESVPFRPELGFRVLLGELRLATGLSWDGMFPYICGGLFALFAISMLYLGYAAGAGPLVGILALGTPTTIRFLGPAYAVPVSVGLLFLATLALIFLSPATKTRWQLPVIVALLSAGTLLVHPPTAMVVVPLVVVSGLYLGRGDKRARNWPARLCVILGISLPLVWFISLSGTLRSELLSEAGVSAGSGQGLVQDFVYYAGYVRLVLLAAAVFTIVFWKIWGEKSWIHMFLLAVYGGWLTFIGLHAGGLLPAANFYDRSWLYLDVTMSVIAGIGLMVLTRRFTGRMSGGLTASPWLRTAALLTLTFAVAGNAWYVRANEPTYRLAADTTMADFEWIRENLGDVPGLTLIDPVLAVTYPAVAGRPVYASVAAPRPSENERVQAAFDLLEAPSPDLEALYAENIGIVYWPSWTSADGVVEVRPGVFVVPDGG